MEISVTCITYFSSQNQRIAILVDNIYMLDVKLWLATPALPTDTYFTIFLSL